jgi:hypothetical protein
VHPQSGLKFDNRVRDTLSKIIAEKGVAVSTNETILVSLLKDRCPDGSLEREIALAIDAVQVGVPSELLSMSSGSLPLETVLSKCQQTLEIRRARTAEAAQWAVLTWAVALNRIPAAEMDMRLTPGPEAQFSASPMSIPEGESSTLKWTVQHAASVSIAPGIGVVPAAGERRVSPAQSTTYKLTAKGPGGTAESAIAITVTPPAVQSPDQKHHLQKQLEQKLAEPRKVATPTPPMLNAFGWILAVCFAVIVIVGVTGKIMWVVELVRSIFK